MFNQNSRVKQSQNTDDKNVTADPDLDLGVRVHTSLKEGRHVLLLFLG